MADEKIPDSPMKALAKKIAAGILAAVLAGGGVSGGASYLKQDTDKQELDKRLAVMEVTVGNLADKAREDTGELKATVSKGDAKTDLVLGRIDILVSKVDQLIPAMEDAKQRNRDLSERIDRLANDAKEARKDLRADMSDRMDDLSERVGNIERRLLRAAGSGSTSVGPVIPPSPSADATPFGAPGITEGTRR